MQLTYQDLICVLFWGKEEVSKCELFRCLYYVWGWEEAAHRCGGQGTFQTCGIWRLACSYCSHRYLFLSGHYFLDFKCCCMVELYFLVILTCSSFRNIHSSVLRRSNSLFETNAHQSHARGRQGAGKGVQHPWLPRGAFWNGDRSKCTCVFVKQTNCRVMCW